MHLLWQNSRGSYRPLFSSTSPQSLPEFTKDDEEAVFKSPRLSKLTLFLSMIAMSGWILSVILAVSLRQANRDKFNESSCLTRTSYYSPLIDWIPGTLKEVVTVGTFDAPSPFRGDPSDSIDQEWRKVHMIRPLNITLDPLKIDRLTDKPETVVRNAPQYGGGLYVLPEFSHHLHCVDLLRKVSYFNFDYYKARHDHDFTADEHMSKTHIDHCIEILRQFVMCHADVGLVTAQWVAGHDSPWPDFNTRQMCRDFEGILAWTREHEFPEGTAPMIPSKPQGQKTLDVAP